MLKLYSRYSELDIKLILNVYKDAISRDYPTRSTWESPEALFLDDLRIFFKATNSRLAVWEHENVPVSALRLEAYKDGFLISCLETPPRLRRKGYAMLLMKAVVASGVGPFYAHVAKDNIPSLRLHEKAGFMKLSDHAVFVDGSVYSSALTLIRK